MIRPNRIGAPLALSLALACAAPAMAQVSIQFSTPGSAIGVNLGGYPSLQPIPGYPVYYAPAVNANYFFYDGLYWMYERDNWYASSWYNGPWGMVDPVEVPVYLLRVPVRYYRHPPAYFRSWRADAPPRWQEHWGRGWDERRRGWDRWDRRDAPRPAPLPTYQREFRGDRYPDHERQVQLHSDRYRYEPRDTVTQRAYEQRREQSNRGVRDERRNPQDSFRSERGPGDLSTDHQGTTRLPKDHSGG